MTETVITLSTALGSFVDVMGQTWEVISGNEGLMVMFAGGCLAVAAKVFKKLKNAVK